MRSVTILCALPMSYTKTFAKFKMCRMFFISLVL